MCEYIDLIYTSIDVATINISHCQQGLTVDHVIGHIINQSGLNVFSNYIEHQQEVVCYFHYLGTALHT